MFYNVDCGKNVYAKTVFDNAKVSPDQNSVLMRPETSVYSSLAFRTLKNLGNCSPHLDSLETLHKKGEVPKYFFRNLAAEPGIDFLQIDKRAHRLVITGVATMMSSFLLFMTFMLYFVAKKKLAYAMPFTVAAGISLILLIVGVILCFRGQKLGEESEPWRKILKSFEFALNQERVDISSLHSDSTDDEVRLWADETLTLLAKEVLIPQIQDLPTTAEHLRLSKVAVRLSQFGLGQDWGVYFEAAKKRIDPYAHFNWQI